MPSPIVMLAITLITGPLLALVLDFFIGRYINDGNKRYTALWMFFGGWFGAESDKQCSRDTRHPSHIWQDWNDRVYYMCKMTVRKIS